MAPLESRELAPNHVYLTASVRFHCCDLPHMSATLAALGLALAGSAVERKSLSA